MALGRNSCGHIRAAIALNSKRPVELIDPAVDVEASDLDAYWENLFNGQHLALRPGESPTWVTIKPLTRRQKEAADAAFGERQLASWYLRCGLVAVENFYVYGPEGKDTPIQPVAFEDRGPLGQLVTEKWLDEVNFPSIVRNALFYMIAHLSEARAPLSKPSGPPAGL